MNISLQGKKAIICGSSQGIGRAIAVELALLGADCTLFARNESALKEVVGSLDRSSGQTHEYLLADFGDTEHFQKVISQKISGKTFHILVNNTGGPPPGDIFSATPDAFLHAFQQHLVNNQLLAQAVIPAMISEKYGRIINIISTSVRIPLKNLGVSNTIRAAVASWSKTLSNEIGRHGITVNSVLPGFTETERLDSMIDANAEKQQKDRSQLVKEMQMEIPLRRFGEAEEIAAMVAFLASPAASYVHGVSIPVDGGRTGTI